MEKIAGSIALSQGIKRALIAFLAGAIGVLALPPFNFLPIGFISFPVLVWLLDGAPGASDRIWLWRNASAFSVGWWFGFGYFVAGLWWLGNAILIDAPDLIWAIPLAVLGLPAILAVFFGVATAIARSFWLSGIGRICTLAILFGGIEILRGFAFTGFPWNSLGMMALTHPLSMQITSVIGVEGVTPIAVFIFALPALWAGYQHKWLGAVLGLLLIGGWAGFGVQQLHFTEQPQMSETSIRLVQPSVPQDEKWDQATKNRIFADLLNLSISGTVTKPKPDLVIWPETAVPFLFSERPEVLSTLAQALADGQNLITGIVRREGEGNRERYYNAAVLVDEDGEIAGAADKTHLVPFGEYLPLKKWLSSLGLRQLAEASGAFSPGSQRGQLKISDQQWLYPLICYEAIFPREIQFEPSHKPAAFLNITNDAWFGATPGPYQHFRHAQLRAVEFGIPLIRVANNGLTGIVSARGEIIDGLTLNSVGVVDGQIPGSLSSTLYTDLGEWLRFSGIVFFAFLAGISALLTRRSKI